MAVTIKVLQVFETLLPLHKIPALFQTIFSDVKFEVKCTGNSDHNARLHIHWGQTDSVTAVTESNQRWRSFLFLLNSWLFLNLAMYFACINIGI